MNRIRTRNLTIGLLLMLSAPAHAQLEGTLFTSPEERAYLDYLREEFLANSQDAGFDIEVPEIPTIPVDGEGNQVAEPVEFTLGAIITRRDGSRNVWLNKQIFAEQDLPEFLTIVETGGVLALSLRADGQSFILKPGQTVNVTDGSVVENYQRPVVTVEANVPAAEPTPDEQNAAETEATEVASVETAEPADATTAADVTATPEPPATDIEQPDTAPAAVLGNLPDELLENPTALDEVIEALEIQRAQLDEEP